MVGSVGAAICGLGGGGGGGDGLFDGFGLNLGSSAVKKISSSFGFSGCDKLKMKSGKVDF